MSGKRDGRKSGNVAVLDAKQHKRARKANGRRAKGRRAMLTITNGCFAGLEITLKKHDTSLGSAVSCDICLDHSFVAGEHAIIHRSDRGYEIEDLNSRHGTSVNGEEIHRRALKRGDRIAIGTFELRFSC